MAAALALAACGGGSKASSSTASRSASAPSTPTRAEFIARADRVCQDADTRSNPLNLRLQSATTPSQVSSLLRQQLAIVQSGLASFKAIPEPPADKAQIAGLTAEVDQQVAVLRKIVRAAAAGDQATVSADEDALARLHVRYQRLAQSYGLRVCGGPSRVVSADGKFDAIVPAGFADASQQARGGPITFMYLVVAPVDGGFRTNVNVVREPRDGLSDIGVIARDEVAGLKRLNPNVHGLSRLEPLTVDGEPARGLDGFNAVNGISLHQRQVIVAHGDSIYTITYTALAPSYSSRMAAFDQILSTWHWR